LRAGLMRWCWGGEGETLNSFERGISLG